jgi:hypothetical protein
MVNIWDGTDFRDVSPDEAERLVAEDKAQLSARTPATKLKHRAQFSGYHTAAEPGPSRRRYNHRKMTAEGAA